MSSRLPQSHRLRGLPSSRLGTHLCSSAGVGKCEWRGLQALSVLRHLKATKTHAYQSRKRVDTRQSSKQGPPREKTRHIHTALIGSGVVLPTRHMAGIPLPRRVRHNGTANLLVGDSCRLAASTEDACASPLWDDAQEPAVASLPSLFQQTETAHASQ